MGCWSFSHQHALSEAPSVLGDVMAWREIGLRDMLWATSKQGEAGKGFPCCDLGRTNRTEAGECWRG